MKVITFVEVHLSTALLHNEGHTGSSHHIHKNIRLDVTSSKEPKEEGLSTTTVVSYRQKENEKESERRTSPSHPRRTRLL